MYSPALNAAPMVGVLNGAGTVSSGQMLQFAPVEQQQFNGGYGMPYGWGEPMQAWTSGQQPGPPPAPTLGQMAALQAPPSDPSVGAFGVSGAQAPQQLMCHASVPQQRLPGTPRGSQSLLEEGPSTPLNRVMRSSASPAAPSPWLRTPSPDHGHYNMTNFKTSQERQAGNPIEADPWAGATLMVATRSYLAESAGYLSVATASPVRAMIDNPHCGDSNCAWPSYVYCTHGNGSGWVPQQLLWRCYVDESGRCWACDDNTGTWCWVDEMEKNA